MINWVNISLILGGLLILASIISFFWHWMREKKQTSQPQFQQYPQQQYKTQPQFQQQFQEIGNQKYGMGNIQMQMSNPYVEGTQKWHEFEMFKLNGMQQNNIQNQPTRQMQQDEILKQLMQKNNLMEQELNLLKTKSSLDKISFEQKTPDFIIEQKQEKKQIINDEIKQKKKSGFIVEIQFVESALIDSESADIIKSDLEAELNTNLKAFKKAMKNKNIDIEISYELN